MLLHCGNACNIQYSDLNFLTLLGIRVAFECTIPLHWIFYTELMTPSSTEASWRENAKKPLDTFGQFWTVFWDVCSYFFLMFVGFLGFSWLISGQLSLSYCCFYRSWWFLDVFGFQRFDWWKAMEAPMEAPMRFLCEKVATFQRSVIKDVRSSSRLGISSQNAKICN